MPNIAISRCDPLENRDFELSVSRDEAFADFIFHDEPFS